MYQCAVELTTDHWADCVLVAKQITQVSKIKKSDFTECLIKKIITWLEEWW